jgi:alpha-glucosidase
VNTKPLLQPSWLAHALHKPTADYLSNPNPALGETLTLRLLVPIQAKPDQVVLRTIPNGEQQFTAMQPQSERDGYRVWEAALKINEPRVSYRFAIQTEGRVWWLNALGASLHTPLALFDFKLLADFQPISWLERSVFYQIFPDRFANGDLSNDPVEETDARYRYTRKTFAWGEKAARDRRLMPFYGGDLAGIEAHLDYLEQLGVNALYLNPIFTAFTNHRYDVINFHEVDPVLGGDQALISLRQALSQRDMRYVLDIVPNHCGFMHPWFQSALHDEDSNEKGYFYFGENKQDYVSWMGFGHMPKLNYASDALRREMIEGEDAVFAYWLKPPFAADGWRVDVGNMLGRHDEHQINLELLRSIRSAVKRVSSEAYLVGENFFEATEQLQGDGWDAVMNYTGFVDPILHWLTGYEQDALRCEAVLKTDIPWDTATMLQAWNENLASIPWQIALQQFNLLDSHDTPRLLTLLHGDNVLSQLAAIVQFTFPGVPCLYYGDEIGLTNEEGFDSRNCFLWDEQQWDQESLDFYKKLIALRRTSLALARGEFRVLHSDENLVIYARLLGEEWVLVTANRSEQPQPPMRLEVPALSLAGEREFNALFGSGCVKAGNGWLELPGIPKGGEVWQ